MYFKGWLLFCRRRSTEQLRKVLTVACGRTARVLSCSQTRVVCSGPSCKTSSSRWMASGTAGGGEGVVFASRRGAVMYVLYTSCIFLRPHHLQRIEARVPDFCQHGREWYFQKVGMVYTIPILNSRRCVVAEASAKAVRLSVSVIASSLV